MTTTDITKEELLKKELLKDLVINDNQGYALYFHNKDITIETYNGFENTRTSKLIDELTNFRLASVTKQFIAFSILTLIDENKLSLDTTLNVLFDSLPKYMNNITIKDLLTHTSGIRDFEDRENTTEEQINDYDVLEFLINQDSGYFTPGEKYQYSNSAYILLGIIIEKVSNKTLEDYLDEVIFKKCDMNNSIMNNQGITEISNRALGHTINNNKLVIEDQGRDTATKGDGGIYSSINDLKKWLTFLKNNDVAKDMFISNIVNSTDIEYGYGLRVLEYNNSKIIYHCGETIGTNTIIGFIPDMNMEFIFLTNMNGIDTDIMITNIKRLFLENN